MLLSSAVYGPCNRRHLQSQTDRQLTHKRYLIKWKQILQYIKIKNQHHDQGILIKFSLKWTVKCTYKMYTHIQRSIQSLQQAVLSTSSPGRPITFSGKLSAKLQLLHKAIKRIRCNMDLLTVWSLFHYLQCKPIKNTFVLPVIMGLYREHPHKNMSTQVNCRCIIYNSRLHINRTTCTMLGY